MFSQERLLVSDSSKLGSVNGYPYYGKNLGKNESSLLPLGPGRTLFFFQGLCIRTGGTNSSGNKSSKCWFYFHPPCFTASFGEKGTGARGSITWEVPIASCLGNMRGKTNTQKSKTCLSVLLTHINQVNRSINLCYIRPSNLLHR